MGTAVSENLRPDACLTCYGVRGAVFTTTCLNSIRTGGTPRTHLSKRIWPAQHWAFRGPPTAVETRIVSTVSPEACLAFQVENGVVFTTTRLHPIITGGTPRTHLSNGIWAVQIGAFSCVGFVTPAAMETSIGETWRPYTFIAFVCERGVFFPTTTLLAILAGGAPRTH